MDSEFVKKRLEKDLQELKKMIEKHFEQRKEDEASIQQLEERIVKRKELRAQQLEERAKVKSSYLLVAQLPGSDTEIHLANGSLLYILNCCRSPV